MDQHHLVPKEEKEHIQVGKASHAAGGLSALRSSFRHLFSQMPPLRGLKTLLRLNQKEGFDCPGCAWPEPHDRSIAEFCENGVKAIAEEATTKKIDANFFKKYSITELARKSDYWLSQQGRLCEPLLLENQSQYYKAVSWDNAFDLIAESLKASPPNKSVFYTSGRTSNEAAFLYQLMVRMYGTNNLPDCSNMCHESSGVAMNEQIGIGKGTVTLEDFDLAEVILIYGQNPGTNHPRMLSALEKAAQRGAEIIVINPLKEVGTDRFIHPKNAHKWFSQGTSIASCHLPIKIYGDIALTKGFLKVLIEEDHLNHDFIQHKTNGFKELKQDILNESWDKIEKHTGLPQSTIVDVGRLISKKKKIIACWAMGLTQHREAVGNIQMILNLLLAKGSIGIPGGGACPVRGHSNVQGNRTVGIWERPSETFLNSLEKKFQFTPPVAHGHNVVEAVMSMEKGHVDNLVCLGGNILSAMSDTHFSARAMRKTKLSVQISTKLNRSHLIPGAKGLILPCLGRTEIDRGQFVTVENSMGIVHSSKGHLKPASPLLKSEVEIVCELAKKLLGNANKWDDWKNNYDDIRDLIADTLPGFKNYNSRVRNPGGFSLPNPPRDHQNFSTTSGRALFISHPIPDNSVKNNEYMMMTIRTHDQFNTTVYGLQDRYRGIRSGRRVVLMNREDMQARQFNQHTCVNLQSTFNNQTRVAEKFFVIPYDIPKGCVATYFPEANPLIPIDSYAKRSMTPTSKSVVIQIIPVTKM